MAKRPMILVSSSRHAARNTANTYHAVFPGAEFGGVKHSGFGRDGGRVAVEEWTQTKAMMTLALPAL